MKRHPTIVNRDQAVVIVVDYQNKIADVMKHHDSVTKHIVALLQGVRALHVPILTTEQYPKGLGHTTSEIAGETASGPVIEKTTFSCCGAPEFCTWLESQNRQQAVLVGIETHVCVLQTALDLLENGYQVHLPIETTCSRSDEHKQNALARLRDAGAVITNVESVLFELLVDAKSAEFKTVQKLIV